MKISVVVDRIPQNCEGTLTTQTETIHLILEGENIGLITSTDTLALLKLNPNIIVTNKYKDLHHNGQLYMVRYYEGKEGFILFITPLRPYIRKVHALIIKNI